MNEKRSRLPARHGVTLRKIEKTSYLLRVTLLNLF